MAAGHAVVDGGGGRRRRRPAPDRLCAHTCRRTARRGRRMSALWRSLRQTLMAVLCDRYAIVVMVGAVILYSFFYPAAYRHQVAGNLPVLVVDEDHSATSRELLRRLDALRVARVVGQPADVDSARRQLEAGHA
ncbi:membrane protein, partial [Stenotrophomonas maltophilia]